MSSTETRAVVVGIFNQREQAVKGIQALKNAGFADDQIGVASREWSKQLHRVGVEEQHTTEQGAVTGALVGGGLGTAIGLVGAILVPGVIPILAGHALLAAIGGGLAGAGGGVFAGSFVALGMAETDAKKHEREIEQGKIALLVYAPRRQEEARSIMVQQGAYDESMSTSP